MVKRVALPVLMVLVTLAATALPAHAQESGGRYYPETGHTLAAEFVDYYDSHGGLEILGYPITDAFIDPLSAMLIQYTQTARLELVPDLYGAGAVVRLSSLGESLDYGQPQSAASSDPGCRYFVQSGHNVCHAFQAFFEEHGGPAVFGYPISEFTLEGDRIVQYFQGFRLDWRPDAPGGGRVQVGPLGRLHFDRQGYDPAFLRPHLPSDPIFYRVVELRAQASVWRPVTMSDDTQELYVLVRDQTANPIVGASVVLIAHFPGLDQTVIMPLTDEHGLSQLTLAYDGVPPGSSVELEFIANYGDLRATTRDSFRVWW
ncbi:MAG: hypothetical protein A2Y93_07870 [Chloroflexi bacterium RBG_13_68_17]|jgi:hypothetical protein|nr:MAG: hypothetical protein A2Y93_07870 [Chloroflexi bacterium RBG_13_68_17]